MKYDVLKLENQLCFPLYAAAKEIVKRYKPYLDPIGLTYTQYIVMLVLWEKNALTVKELGSCLYLDSGTLTPLLKKMEADGLIIRKRDHEDERSVIISLTEQGVALRDKAIEIPTKLSGCIALSGEEAGTLYVLLNKLLGQM